MSNCKVSGGAPRGSVQSQHERRHHPLERRVQVTFAAVAVPLGRPSVRSVVRSGDRATTQRRPPLCSRLFLDESLTCREEYFNGPKKAAARLETGGDAFHERPEYPQSCILCCHRHSVDEVLTDPPYDQKSTPTKSIRPSNSFSVAPCLQSSTRHIHNPFVRS
jgi:hypothetical protein